MLNISSSAELKDKRLVLLVDDTPDNLKMLWTALDQAGYDVLIATDGHTALERLDYVMPDIVLLDAMMPGIDGFETCRRMKARPRTTHIPVVFMTGLTDSQDVVRGFQAGGIDYVTKPLNTDIVLARLDAHLRSHRLMTAALDAIDAVDTAVVTLDDQGQAIWKTARARQWLQTYFGLDAEAAGLPEPLQRWIGQTLMPPVAAQIAPLIRVGTAHQLVMRLTRRTQNPSGELTLLLEEHPLPADPRKKLVEQYQLTGRETDVLLWLAKGKTNRDIGEILGIAPRTVNKHLEHIFVKLGVETRAAATALTMKHMHHG